MEEKIEGAGALFRETKEFIEASLMSECGIMGNTDAEIPVIRKPGGVLDRVPQRWIDEAKGAPSRRTGTASLLTLDSFIAHVNRFGDEDSAVFADDNPTAPSLTAVLDYHRRDRLANDLDDAQEGTRIHGGYRFGEHRSKFAFPVSPEWTEWTGADGEKMNMVEFAEFIEKHGADIDVFDDKVIPDALARFVEQNGGKDRIASFGQLVELSRGLKVNEGSVIGQAVNLSSGEGRIEFTSEHTTSVRVPTMFFIAIPVFRKGAFYRIGCALRYRKVGAALSFWFDLFRPDRVFDHAVAEAVQRVALETEAQVLYGKPEA